MENVLIIIGIVLLALASALLLAVFYLVRKGYRFFKRWSSGEMTDEEFERLSKKNYRRKEGPTFDKDYFKGSGWQRGQQQQRQSASQRTTRTADGVTIVDRRDPNKKKIFARDEGEYVDFKEVEE